MTPIKALIFGIDDLFPQLRPYYNREVEKGNLEIVGYAAIQNDQITLVKNLSGAPLLSFSFQKIIISSQCRFMTVFKSAKRFFSQMTGGGRLSH